MATWSTMPSSIDSRIQDVLNSVTTIAIGLVEAAVVIVIARFVQHILRDQLLSRIDSPSLSESSRTLINVMTTVVVGIISGTILLALWGVTWSAIVATLGLGTLGLLLGIQDLLRSL